MTGNVSGTFYGNKPETPAPHWAEAEEVAMETVVVLR